MEQNKNVARFIGVFPLLFSVIGIWVIFVPMFSLAHIPAPYAVFSLLAASALIIVVIYRMSFSRPPKAPVSVSEDEKK